jgi:hypothetical protein
MRKKALWGVVLFVCFAAASVSWAAEGVGFVGKTGADSKPGFVVGSLVSAKATVEAINAETREVTLKNEAGNTMVLVCGPEVQNFAQIKVGDVVNAEYGEAAVIVVKEAEGTPANTQTGAVERAPLGEKPAAKAVKVTELQATVEEINYETRYVSLKGAEGRSLNFIASDEVKRLNEIKKGDQVVVRITQALAVSVTTPEAVAPAAAPVAAATPEATK